MSAKWRTAPGRIAWLLLLAAGAGCAALAGLVWHLDGELTAARGKNIVLQQRIVALDRRPSVEPFQEEARKWRARAEELEAQIAAATQFSAVAAAAASAHSAPAAIPVPSPLAQMAAMLNNPAMRDFVAAQQEKAVLVVFNDFFERVRLPHVEEQRLLRLFVDKQLAQMDYGLKALDPNFSATERAALYQRWTAANDAADENIRGILASEENFALYQTFLQQQPERLEVSTLDTRLGNAGTPLTPAQRESLVSLMFEARREFAFTDDFYDRTQFTRARLNAEAIQRFYAEQGRLQQAIAERAAAILGAERMPAFRNNQAAMRDFMRSQMFVAREVMGAGP